jgi:hypothetical protein
LHLIAIDAGDSDVVLVREPNGATGSQNVVNGVRRGVDAVRQ